MSFIQIKSCIHGYQHLISLRIKLEKCSAVGAALREAHPRHIYAYKVLFAGSVKFDLGRVRCGALKYVYWIAPMRS